MRLARRLLLAAGAAALAAPAVLRAQPPVRLTVLHTNDVHSRHEPINRFGAACRADEQQPGACFGGSARLAAAIVAERGRAEAEGRVVLTLDAGDQFMGSLFYTHWRGEAERAVMDAIGYDAMAIGNHEFDNGPPVLARFGAALGCPLVSANIDASAEPALAPLIRPFAIVARGGVRIGIVGLTTTDTPRISSPGPHLRFADETAALRTGAEAARDAGAEVVLALTHVGLPADLALAAAVPGLSAVIGGHSHTLLSNSANGAAGRYPLPVDGAAGFTVPVVQAGANNRYLGRLDLDLDRSGRVLVAGGDARELGFGDPRHPGVEALIGRLAEPLAALRARVIGTLAEPVSNAGCRSGECALGTMVAEAMLEAGRSAGATIALQNGGGLRAGLPAGPITWGDVLAVLPFSNTLATLKLTGADIRAALETGLSGVEQQAGRFPQVAGLRFTWHPEAPSGQRLRSVAVRTPEGGYAPLDHQRIYGVVTNNFLRLGGDGYAVLRERAVAPYDSGPNLEEVFESWLARRSPVQPETDGRIARAQ
ncbi:bifunctional metallophosphatase/5'-nucleotidase [Elioraea sp.]|uniref:bifunctional metallophosphatase/5'-nucleotidase n=1 Tax=Elioraea sp. TaxID=2185103 RepID=UPI003F6FB7FE